MNKFAIFVVLAAIYVHQGIAVRIPASSPVMWGRQRLTQPFYEGWVVGKEDDNTIVYFYNPSNNSEFIIYNDEHYASKLVMDIDPHAIAISIVYAKVMALFERVPTHVRYHAYISSYGNLYGRHVYGIAAYDEDKKHLQKKWVQQYLNPFITSDLKKIRPFGVRRKNLCWAFNPGCQTEDDCILIDDLLPLVGCKGHTTPAPTLKPTKLPTTKLTTTPTPPTTPPPPPPPPSPSTPTPPTTLPRTPSTPPPSTLLLTPSTLPPTLPAATGAPVSTKTSVTDDPDLEEINKVLDQDSVDTDEELDLDNILTLLLPAVAGCIVLVSVIIICIVKRRRSQASAKPRDEEAKVTRTEKRKRRRRKEDLGNTDQTSDRRARRKGRENRGMDNEDRRKRRRRRDQ